VQQRANQAANCFREAGLESEQRLLLSLPDGIDYVAALFGALKVGAAVVMVNPGLSQEAMAEMLDYSRARLAVSREDLPASRYLRAQLKSLQHSNSDFENFPTHRDDVAIWLFSGGTTGRPKAVLQSHGSFWNTTELYAKQFLGYTSSERTLAVPKLFFGYATGSNLFFPFSVGATAILFEGKCTAEALFEQIERHRPTLLISVPTMVSHMLEQPERDLSCLRLVTSAGEALPEALYWKWRETFAVELLDGLGTAEMWHIFLSNRPGEVKPGSLGRVVPGFEIKVCDDHGQEVATGEVGRLWVAGDSRAHCYWQLGQASQEAFRGRYFASSDLVRQDEQGYIFYCGRGDELLKVAGRWVAPQEVESCLLGHPAVAQCSVVGGEDREGLVKPVAFVQLRSQASEEDLKAYSLEHLEAFKHPRRVIVLNNFPQTHLGKVDRGALRRMAGELLSKGTSYP
jgi:acyl-coenzyme A synthetase/AMP-(fatty) acid ligase